MNYAWIKNGSVENVTNTPVDGYTQVPDHVRSGDTTDGVRFFRGGIEVTDQGFNIPVGDLFAELTDAELNTIISVAFPAATAQQRGLIGFLFRAAAQTEIHSANKRLPAARALFTALLGEGRMNELFRQR
jgi:hypothetical protein